MNAMQCRMARAALKIEVRALARSAGVSPNTIARLERGETLKPSTVEAIQAVLEQSFLEFIPESDTYGAGVRARWPDSDDIPDDLIAQPTPGCSG